MVSDLPSVNALERENLAANCSNRVMQITNVQNDTLVDAYVTLLTEADLDNSNWHWP